MKNLKNQLKKTKVVDSFQYRITIEDNDEKYIMDVNEFQMNSELGELIDFLENKC
jgi:hypothetical protein